MQHVENGRPLAGQPSQRMASPIPRLKLSGDVQSDPEKIASSLASSLRVVLSQRDPLNNQIALDLTNDLIECARRSQTFRVHCGLLLDVCLYFFEIGTTQISIDLGHRLAAESAALNERALQRRLMNTLGGQYGDISDFASAMQCIQVAIELARQLGDPIGEAACLANAAAVLQEMGHYRQSIRMAQRVLRLEDVSSVAMELRLQAASNGLFSAHRIGERSTARSFLESGERCLSDQTPILRRAFFDRNRTLYLVDAGFADQANAYVDDAIQCAGSEANPRVRILLRLSKAICTWGLGDKATAHELLQALYQESKKTRLYHHFVLQSGIKLYSNPISPEEASAGLEYARELVEFTTSVKKAKFYRQLSHKRSTEVGAEQSFWQGDSFTDVRGWLGATDIPDVSNGSSDNERRELTKHEELTAIHEDIARLRAMRLRREIRTDAVDTAENWAIAAEFFDDETGQHCYRVGHLAGMLARGIGMDETFCVQVEHAARLHDIGKIAVNELILLKPGPLDASEMAAMRLHTEVGAQILAGSDDPTLRMAVDIARHHHEWWNGAGYPKKLSGRDIPVSARVCAFADVYDALTHARVYKKAWTHERALEEIVRLKGVQFDPEMIDVFIDVLDRYRADLDANAIPGFVDMDSNALIASRKRLMDTIGSEGP